MVVVPAAGGWLDTGIDVAPGEELLFSATGEINLQKGNPEAVCGPEGLDLVTVEQPVPDANLGALIGRIAQLVASRVDEDSGLEVRDEVFVLFLVGPESAVSVPFKGRLYPRRQRERRQGQRRGVLRPRHPAPDLSGPGLRPLRSVDFAARCSSMNWVV